MPRIVNDVCIFQPIDGLTIRDEASWQVPDTGQLVRVVCPPGAYDANMTWCFVEDVKTRQPLGFVPCDTLKLTHVRNMEVNQGYRYGHHRP